MGHANSQCGEEWAAKHMNSSILYAVAVSVCNSEHMHVRNRGFDLVYKTETKDKFVHL